MNALDTVLLAYREMFGIKTERGNETHRDACIEVARLRDNQSALKAALAFYAKRYHDENHIADKIENCGSEVCQSYLKLVKVSS